MTNSNKNPLVAGLLAILTFPFFPLGHWYTKHFWRGMGLIVISWIIWSMAWLYILLPKDVNKILSMNDTQLQDLINRSITTQEEQKELGSNKFLLALHFALRIIITYDAMSTAFGKSKEEDKGVKTPTPPSKITTRVRPPFPYLSTTKVLRCPGCGVGLVYYLPRCPQCNTPIPPPKPESK